MRKNKILIIVSVMLFFIAIIGSAIAYFNWGGEESKVSLTVSTGIGSCTQLSDNNISLVPVSSKEKGRIIKLSAKQEMASKTMINWTFVVKTFNELINESFKYELVNTTTGVSYGSGNFGSITEDNNQIIFSGNELMDYGTEYEFTLYLWIGGVNFSNPIEMANKTFNFDIMCSIVNSLITLDSGNNNNNNNNNGTSTLYVKDGNIYLDSSMTKLMTIDQNAIIVPNRDGYTFGGYYTETTGSGIQIISDTGYITSEFANNPGIDISMLYANWIDNNYTNENVSNFNIYFD